MKKTVKLYDFDAYLEEFSAKVISSEKAENGYKIILDKTAFFPEAGGQPSDTGTLDGITVTYVSENGGIITHFTEKPLCTGTVVKGKIDFKRRFGFMQNHSGEHIVSGIVHKKFGFDNVSFHLNSEFATLDFNGILTREQLDLVENEANRAVWKNLPVRAWYPEKNELENIEYRSKKELSGDIRLVEIKDTDVCACCAPHVKSTGEIGVIKLLDFVKMRGGTRIVLKCGKYALLDYRNKYENVLAVSNMLSSKQEETAVAVENLLKKADDIKRQVAELNKLKISGIVTSATPQQCFFYEENFEMKELQQLADSLHKTYGGNKAVFSGESEKLNFVLCGSEAEITPLFQKFKAEFSARGGGRNGMFSGSVGADIKKIESFFNGEK